MEGFARFTSLLLNDIESFTTTPTVSEISASNIKLLDQERFISLWMFDKWVEKFIKSSPFLEWLEATNTDPRSSGKAVYEWIQAGRFWRNNGSKGLLRDAIREGVWASEGSRIGLESLVKKDVIVQLNIGEMGASLNSSFPTSLPRIAKNNCKSLQWWSPNPIDFVRSSRLARSLMRQKTPCCSMYTPYSYLRCYYEAYFLLLLYSSGWGSSVSQAFKVLDLMDPRVRSDTMYNCICAMVTLDDRNCIKRLTEMRNEWNPSSNASRALFFAAVERSRCQSKPLVYAPLHSPPASQGNLVGMSKYSKSDTKNLESPVTAMWTRTTSCPSCGYVLLEEETQACCWEEEGLFSCRVCGCKNVIEAMIGYKNVTGPRKRGEDDAQIRYLLDGAESLEVDGAGFVRMMNPHDVLECIESILCEGDHRNALSFDRILHEDKILLYNMWYFCTRFGLPLPLNDSKDITAAAAWDSGIAISYARAWKETGEEPNVSSLLTQDWEDRRTSQILIALVEDCEVQDLKKTLSAFYRSHSDETKKEQSVTSASSRFSSDAYKTLLLLLRTQSPQLFPRLIPTLTKLCNSSNTLDHICKAGRRSTFDKLFARVIKSREEQVNESMSRKERRRSSNSKAIAFRNVFSFDPDHR